MGGFLETVGAADYIATTMGAGAAAGGSTIMVHGIATMTMGIAKVIDGLFGSKEHEIPVDPVEVAGMALGHMVSGDEGGKVVSDIGSIATSLVGTISSGSLVRNLRNVGKAMDESILATLREMGN